MAENFELEDELLPPPPKRKSASSATQDTGDFLPKPPLKKYTPLYYWHKVKNFFATI